MTSFDRRCGADGKSHLAAGGAAAGAEVNTFFDPNCVNPGTLKAKKCTLGDPLTLASKVPPRDCTLYLNDVNGPCSAWIPGCMPGVRAGRSVMAYVWSDQPTNPSTYAPDSRWSYNASGATNQITRLGTGIYEVVFPGVSPYLVPPYNNVQVSAYGSTSARCVIAGWNPAPAPDMELLVYCTNAAGTLADQYFSALVIE